MEIQLLACFAASKKKKNKDQKEPVLCLFAE
jgi:hypothetical protein